MALDHGAVRAAQTYLRAHLGWLRGYPIFVENSFCWQSVPALGLPDEPTTIHIDREQVRKATFAVNRVQAKFPKALTAAVGDVDEWRTRVMARIEIFKRTIHEGHALPSLTEMIKTFGFRRSAAERARSLAASATLAPLIEALVWIGLHDGTDLEQEFAIVETYRKPIQKLLEKGELVLAITLIKFLREGLGASTLALLGNNDFRSTPAAHFGYLQKLRAELRAIKTTGELSNEFITNGIEALYANGPETLSNFVFAVARLTKEQRKLQLNLLEAQLNVSIVSSWRLWWEEAKAVEQDMRRDLGAGNHQSKKAFRETIRSMRTRLNTLEQSTPEAHYLETSVENAADIGEVATLAADLLSLAPEFGDSLEARHQFHNLLNSWKRDVPLSISPRARQEIIAGLRQLVPFLPSDQTASKRILEDVFFEASDQWVKGNHPLQLIRPWFQAAVEWIKITGDTSKISLGAWDVLLTAVENTPSPETAAKVMATVPNWEGNSALLAFLLELANGDPEDFQAFAETWPGGRIADRSVETLRQIIADANMRELIRYALKCGDGKRLLRVASQAELAKILGCDLGLPPPANHSFDLTTYPEDLKHDLSVLASWDKNAQNATDKILGGSFPRPDRVQQEIDAIQQLIKIRPEDASTLRGRLSKLETQLQGPANITEAQMMKYKRKLAVRIGHAQMAAWEKALTDRLQAALQSCHDVRVQKEWFEKPETLEVIGGIAELTPNMQKLAWRLIKARFGPPPWDFREECENREFLERISKLGIKIKPWLDGIAPQSGVLAGHEVEFKLEPDPIEVMRMGAFFQTCLAPDGFNFFSAVANAADVNKRVLYARDQQGRIWARCLLGLTDEGDVVAFYVYSHEDRPQAQKLVATFIERLTQEMRSNPAPKGAIRKLVAPSWYDDGPVDVTGQLSAIGKGSPFDKALKTLVPKDLRSALSSALGDAPMTPAVIESLVRLENFKNRPELVKALIPMLNKGEGLDISTRLYIVQLIAGSGDKETALELLDATAKLLTSAGQDFNLLTAAQIYCEVGAPERALQMLRRLSGNWLGCYDPTLIRAKALAALHRPRQALDAYRKAASEGATIPASVFEELEKILQ